MSPRQRTSPLAPVVWNVQHQAMGVLGGRFDLRNEQLTLVKFAE